MSNAQTAIAKAKVQLPVNYDEELAAEALAMKGRIGAPSGDLIRVSTDKLFTLPSGESSEALAVVVAGFITMNQYYTEDYDSKNVVPPVCMAMGQEIATLRPYDKVPDKQNADCATCWANQYGSKKKGKACSNYRVLAVLAPDTQADGPLMILKVSPTATRFWDSYVTQCLAKNLALIKVITEITFDPNSKWPSLRFRAHAPNETPKDAFDRRTAALSRLLTEPDFAPTAVVKPNAKTS